MIGIGFDLPGRRWLQLAFGSGPVTAAPNSPNAVVTHFVQDNFPGNQPALTGNWQWLQSSGKWRLERSPASTGFMHALAFTENNDFTIWKNDAVIGQGQYVYLANQGGAHPAGIELMYHTPAHLFRRNNLTFRFIGKNTLCLTEESRFRKTRHLFLRSACI